MSVMRVTVCVDDFQLTHIFNGKIMTECKKSRAKHLSDVYNQLQMINTINYK